MRRLIEGLDELAGHDVLMARSDRSKVQTIAATGAAPARRASFWSLVSTPRSLGLVAPERPVPPVSP